MASGQFVYQAQAPGGVINQIVVPEPIRAKPRPVDVRPRRDRTAIERTDVLADLVEAIGIDPVQIVAADGWGKTSTLRQASYLDSFEELRDGIAHVSGWGLPVDDVEQAIFEAFYESNMPDVRVKASQGQLRTSLADIQAAVIVDDLDIPRQHVDRVIDGCGECTFLSSASSQTMWSGGTVLDLAGLAADDSVELFRQRLGRQLETTERDAVVHFSTAVAGFPMAVVSAAAAVRRNGLAFDDLASIATAADPTAEIHSAISGTLNLREERLLAVLAALDGSPLPSAAIAAAASVEHPEEELEKLKKDGVLQAASPTYRLPGETAAHLDLSDASDSTVRGLTDWCRTEERPEAIASAGPAIATAMRAAIQKQDAEAAIELGRTADAGLAVSARWGLWSDVLSEVKRASSASDDQFSHAWSLHQLGTKALTAEGFEIGQELLTQAETIRESIGDTSGLEATRHNLQFAGPPAVIPPEPPPPPPTPGTPWWVWTLVVAAAIVVGGIVTWIVSDGNRDTPTPISTEAPSTGELTASVSVMEFLNVPLEERVTAEVEIINTGPGPIDIESVHVEDDTFFSPSDDCGRLEASETCRVVVTFSADVLDLLRSAVIVEHTGRNGPLRIELFGEAIDPPSASLLPDPINIDFGAVRQENEKVILTAEEDSEWSRTIEVTNGGNVGVDIVDVSLHSGRFVQFSNCGFLEPGQICRINVRFLAIEPGTYEDGLIIEHTGDNPTIEIPVTGIVLERPNLTIEVTNSSEFLDSFVLDNDLQADVRDQLDVVVLESIEQTPVETPEWLVAFVIDDVQMVQVPDWIRSFPVQEAQPEEPQIFWVFAIEVAITNRGGVPAEGEFFFHLEYLLEAELLPLWLPAIKDGDPDPRFRVDTTVFPGERVGFVVEVGILRSAQQANEPARIRAVVDSCFNEPNLPTPPCRIVESNEDDNISRAFNLPFVQIIE
ncbi:MAG: hypothetical protein ABFR95_05675 [Actinomycetota bacterium]